MSAWQPSEVVSTSDVSVVQAGFTPRHLPGWLVHRATAAARRDEIVVIAWGGDGLACRLDRLRVILSTATRDDDGHTWAHLSASRRDGRLPGWDELVHARDVLLGDDVEAYQVAPPRSRYVNRHAGTLHLWADLQGPVLPAFEGMGSDGELTI